MFTLVYDELTQDNMYHILSESVGFCRRYDKTFWCFFPFTVNLMLPSHAQLDACNTAAYRVRLENSSTLQSPKQRLIGMR